MARVTVEDCLREVENRFDLILKASKRAHQLELGAADPTVARDNDKPTVVALREIAAGNDITQTRTSHDVEVDIVDFDDIESMNEVEVVAPAGDAELDMDALLAAELAANLAPESEEGEDKQEDKKEGE